MRKLLLTMFALCAFSFLTISADATQVVLGAGANITYSNGGNTCSFDCYTSANLCATNENGCVTIYDGQGRPTLIGCGWGPITGIEPRFPDVNSYQVVKVPGN